MNTKNVYTPDDIKKEYEQHIGFPGQEPFTRGIHPMMYRSRLWTMRQYSGYGSAEETNKRFHYLLSEGQTGLSIAFDLPTQIGYDSDDSLVEGEVGKVGVPISTVDDMARLFSGITLEKVSTSMTINATASIILSMYLTVAEAQNANFSRLHGTVQNDILKEYIARGTYIYPPEPSMKLAIDLIEYCNSVVPKWYPISISGYHIREAGSTAVQELAFTFGNAIAYLDYCKLRKLNLENICSRLSFFFNAHINFFEEIAKFRAARRVYAKLIKDRFEISNLRAQQLRFHTQTAGSSLTAQEPENNIIRTTLEALAAVLGGTQSLHTNSMDEALALPTEKAVKIALRTQQIIAYESGVTNTVDPVGGAYYIEYLTDTIEEQVWKYLEKIESLGGMIKAIEKGYIQTEIANSAYQYQKELENNSRFVIGLNKFAGKEKPHIERFIIDKEAINTQIARTRDFKKNRDPGKVSKALDTLRKNAEKDVNLIPFIRDAVKSRATLGEIANILREVFGVFKP